MFGFVIYLYGEEITTENKIYESYDEAMSEAGFAVRCYADLMDVNWSEFDIEITSV